MIRCSCGNQLTYETDICDLCWPNGLQPSVSRNRKPDTSELLIEFGFKGAERGWNLDKTIHEYRKTTGR